MKSISVYRKSGITLQVFQYLQGFRAKQILLALFLIFIQYPIAMQAQTLNTVQNVDLARYAGTWYEIASFPQRFQKGCFNTTATYTLTGKGYVIVENRCNKDSFTGKLSYIKGKAFVEKESGNAKLKVQFFWPFRGKYWIIDLADDYSYAVVGHPNRQYLWILSRAPMLSETVYKEIILRLINQGFDTSKLRTTQQKI
jgi:apolipoprotein D and lipocalin family protein